MHRHSAERVIWRGSRLIASLLDRLVSCRWNFQMPAIVLKSISILSDAGLGMAMFSLGRYHLRPNFPPTLHLGFSLVLLLIKQ